MQIVKIKILDFNLTFSKKYISYTLHIYNVFNINMSIENPSERLERTEAYLKQRLLDYKDVMPIKGWNKATLLEIYWEWMDYLVKENLKKRSDLLPKWQRFLLQRNTDSIADLLIGFFEAKRRYGRDKERKEDKRDWFALCKNYCNKNGWDEDEDLLYSFFSSYSWAERRIYRKVEEGKILADTSKSLLETIDLTKAEMAQKEAERKRKAEEKVRKQLEKQKRKEERERKREEKNNKKNLKKTAEETHNFIDEWAENHYAWNDRDVVDENGDVVLNPKNEHIPVENTAWDTDNIDEDSEKEKGSRKTEKSTKKVNPQQLEFPFEYND